MKDARHNENQITIRYSKIIVNVQEYTVEEIKQMNNKDQFEGHLKQS